MNSKIFIISCMFINTVFAGGWISQIPHKQEAAVPLPSHKILSERIERNFFLLGYINEERFMQTFAGKNINPEKIPGLLQKEFEATYQDIHSSPLALHHDLMQQNFENKKEKAKNLLLEVLLEEHPEQLKKIREKQYVHKISHTHSSGNNSPNLRR
jgi:hypothetical protein